MSRHFHSSLNLFGLEAIRALYRNKLRSVLAAIGITIGIAAVVCIVAIGTAGVQRAEEQLKNLGDNLVWIEAGSRNVNGVRTGAYGMTSLTMEDAEAILQEVSLIKSVSPQVDGSVLIACGNRNWTTHYRGVTPEFLEIRRWELAEGVPFTREDVEHAANVCMIGQTVRQQLFGEEEAVGREVRINKQIFRVIGVLVPKGQSGNGQDQDDNILMPYTTAQKKLRGKDFTWLNDIMCSAVSLEAAKPAIDRISGLLRERHHIRPGEEDDFNIRHPEEVIKAQIAASRTLAFFLISVASICPPRRWDRDHERDAGIGDRTNEGNWFTPRGWSHDGRHTDSVSRRSRHVESVRRPLGSLFRDIRLFHSGARPGMACIHSYGSPRRLSDIRFRGGHLIRLLSRAESHTAGPDRRFASGVRRSLAT